MKIALLKKTTVGLVLVVLATAVVAMLIPVLSRQNAAEEKAQFNRLDKEWLAKALSANPEQKDPRRDDDILATANAYWGNVISANYYEDSGGAGWLLSGGVVDLVKKEDVTYALYSRQVQRYEFGIWNNVLDSERSFDSLFLIRYEDGQAEILDYRYLGPRNSQISVGLRLNESGAIEALQNRNRSTANDAEIVGIY